MHNARKTRVLLAALLVFSLPAGAAAQVSGIVSLDGHAGFSFPTGTLGDLTGTGGAFGGGLAIHFHPNWAVRGDVVLVKLDNGRDDSGALLSPPVDMLYYGGGIEVNFDAPMYQDLPLTFAANIGGGVMGFDVDETFSSSHPANGIDESYLTLTLGGQIGYDVYRSSGFDVNIFVKPQVYLVLTDSADMIPYATLLGVEPFDHVWLIPVTAGLRLTF